MNYQYKKKCTLLLFFISVIFFSFTAKTGQNTEDYIINFFKAQQSVQQEKLYLHLDKPYYAAGDSIWFKGYLVDGMTLLSGMPDNFIYVELLNQKDSILFRKKIKQVNQAFYGTIPLPADIRPGQYVVRSYTNWMRNVGEDFFYNRKLEIGNSINPNLPVASDELNDKGKKKKSSNATSDFSLTFFPEGGNLLTNVSQQVAFKCQQEDGYGKEISGVITTQAGETIRTFKTEHDGMGVVQVYPEAGQQLIARVDGTGELFNLPMPKTDGLSISITQGKNKVRYQIISSPEYAWPDSLFLVAHTRGCPVLLTPVSKDNAAGIIEENTFTEGISHFILIDKNGTPISQRLLFIYPELKQNYRLTCDKEEYSKREKVSLQVDLKALDGQPVNGDFSISVTDSKTVKTDSLGENILSNLLLTSDLKGYIDNPGYYFMYKDKQRLRDLDLLMLTHGWSRFPIENLKKIQEIKPEYFIEKGQFVSGKIVNFLGRAAKEAKITAIEPKNEILSELTTNDKGEFLLDGIDYKDSTTFVIQARTKKKGLALVEINLDEETIPERTLKIFHKQDTLQKVSNDYLFNTREKFYYEGGVRVYELGEVVIEAKSQAQKEEEHWQVRADYVYDASKRINSTTRTAQDLFELAYPNRKDSGAPLVVLDGMLNWDDDYILNTIYVEDIKTFYLYKDQGNSKYGTIGKPGPAVVITLTEEARKPRENGIAWFKTLGYSEMGEFYSPVYDTPEKQSNHIPDLRTTIYWNPVLPIDSTGKATVEFYTSDSSSPYNVEIEGVSKNGKIFCIREQIQKK